MNEWWLKQNFWYVLLWVYIMCSTWHIVSDNCGRLISASKCQSKLYFSAVLTHGTFEKKSIPETFEGTPPCNLQEASRNHYLISPLIWPQESFSRCCNCQTQHRYPALGTKDIRMNWKTYEWIGVRFFFRNNSFVCLPIHSYVFGTQPSGAHKTCNQF